MSTNSKLKKIANNANNNQKDSISKSTKRSIKAGSENKIARDLREQFDEYVLNQDNEQDLEQSPKADEDNQDIEQIEDEQQSQMDAVQQQHIKHNVPQQTKYQPHLRRQSRVLSYHNSNTGGGSQSNSRKIKINKLVTQYQQPPQSKTMQVPRSYLLALQHLQSALDSKDAQIITLKQQLIEKEEVIYGCQTKINQILIKYHELSDVCELREAEIRVLKQQMDELKRDKEITLKQAARLAREQFKEAGRTNQVEENSFASFKNRSMSSNLGPSLNREPLLSASYSKQIPSAKQTMPNFKKNMLASTQLYKPAQPIIQKSRVQTVYPSFTARPSTTNNSPFLCSSPPMQLSEKERNRDFISYQREILRSEKQLIALKYRMECLERKLSTNPKEDNVKQKIRKLSQEIQNKQRTINDLKKL